MNIAEIEESFIPRKKDMTEYYLVNRVILLHIRVIF